MSFAIRRLISGGMITNYHCPSRCAHCLYACGPERGQGYISPGRALAGFKTARRLGCHAMHIGGGEPMLNPDGLILVLEAAGRAGIQVEYVETNSSWHRDHRSSTALLKEMRALGLGALMVSISPFHNGFIPFDRVRGVLAACREAEVPAYPWVAEFAPELESLEASRPHQLEEYEQKWGPDYLAGLPGRFWLHFGGRAATTYARVLPLTPTNDLVAGSGPCHELEDTSHFHMDLKGNYIPGLCTGLAFNQEYMGRVLPKKTHPVLTALFETGVAGVVAMARDAAGFEPHQAYLNKCHLCLHARLALYFSPARSRDLAPDGFYGYMASEFSQAA